MALPIKPPVYSESPSPASAVNPAPNHQEVLALAAALAAGLRDLRRAQAQALGLNPAAFALLDALAQGPAEGLLVSQAAAALGVRPQALSALAAHLAEQGWLAREVDPGDGRARRLALTPQGRADLAPAQRLGQALGEELSRLMPNPALAKLVFGKFLQAMEAARGGAAA